MGHNKIDFETTGCSRDANAEMEWWCSLRDKNQNELIRGTFGVKGPVSSEVVERRLNWYRHIEGRDGKRLLQKEKDF